MPRRAGAAPPVDGPAVLQPPGRRRMPAPGRMPELKMRWAQPRAARCREQAAWMLRFRIWGGGTRSSGGRDCPPAERETPAAGPVERKRGPRTKTGLREASP